MNALGGDVRELVTTALELVAICLIAGGVGVAAAALAPSVGLLSAGFVLLASSYWISREPKDQEEG